MDIVKLLRMHPYDFARRAADEIEALRQIAKPECRRIEAEEAARWKKAAEANAEENVELRQLLQNMEAARDAALRLKVERQPELGRIADALCEYNERDTQDAARYRWLRARNGGSIGITTFNTDPELEHVLVETEADAAIDAAMALPSNVELTGGALLRRPG